MTEKTPTPKNELVQLVNRAIEADKLIKNPIVIEILEDMRFECFKAIENSNFKNVDDREYHYKMLQTLNIFKDKLETIVFNGTRANEKLKALSNKPTNIY